MLIETAPVPSTILEFDGRAALIKRGLFEFPRTLVVGKLYGKNEGFLVRQRLIEIGVLRCAAGYEHRKYKSHNLSALHIPNPLAATS